VSRSPAENMKPKKKSTKKPDKAKPVVEVTLTRRVFDLGLKSANSMPIYALATYDKNKLTNVYISDTDPNGNYFEDDAFLRLNGITNLKALGGAFNKLADMLS
jgi:hypothetical protein